MVVDDEERLLRLMIRLLTSVGYRVTIFDKPEEALTAFRRTPGAFDLVITDYAMPQISGVELGRLLLEERSDVPVLMVSGNITEEEQETAREDGVREFLAKPFTREEFLSTVRNILDDCLSPSVIP